MSKGDKAADSANARGKSLPARRQSAEIIPAVGFTRVEKNLASLGFFTASSKTVRGTQEKKITLVRRDAGSKSIEATATILPSHKYGLPITSDQDKYLALLKIVAEIRREKGKVENPIGFTSADILRILNKRIDAGKNYEDIEAWLQRMTLTGINSRGVVFLAGRKRWANDTFHVFDRVTSFGKEMPDGTVADRNYVWLSEWQLENINNNFVLPIDLDTYTRVRNHIAKTLIPLLQIWLYASSGDGRFEKRYTELCEILNITRYNHLSKIKEKLGPSLDELVRFEYLSFWKVEKTANRRDYKVVFFHGRKFHTDLLPAGETLEILDSVNEEGLSADDFGESSPRDSSTLPRSLLEELTTRGVGRRAAKALVNELPEGDEALRLLEWADAEISRKRPGNPAGFLIHLIREKVTPPRDFLSSRQLRELERREQANREEQEKRARTHDEYQSFVRDQVDARLRDHSKTEYLERLERKKEELVKKYAVLASSPTRTVEESAERALRDEIQKEIPLPTMEEFLSTRRESLQDEDPDKNV